jgi:hypothetical protein
MAITLNGTTGITTPTYGGAVAAEYIAPVTSFKNRIINGAMQIDQRNAGASVTVNDTAPYVLDRYFAQDATDGSFTVQQSSVAPTGFNNSMLITVATTDASLAAGQVARIVQRIEGFNVADLNWGTAGAQTVTLSFWVRSSVTGAFGGALSNSAFNRSYPFTYTISAANTWEQKTITIAGDTTGTWLTNNGIGLEINFGLGVGSTFSGTAGAWSGSGLMSSTGATNLLATSGATWAITGVQLEKGSTATSFDYRPYGAELALCQRYCFSTTNGSSSGGAALNTTTATQRFSFLVNMRTSPTVSITTAGSFGVSDDYNSDYTASTVTLVGSRTSTTFSRLQLGGFTSLTTGRFYGGVADVGTAVITFSAEL